MTNPALGVGGLSASSGGGPLLGLAYLGSSLGSTLRSMQGSGRGGNTEQGRTAQEEADLMKYRHDLEQVHEYNQNLLAAAHMKAQTDHLIALGGGRPISSVDIVAAAAGHKSPSRLAGSWSVAPSKKAAAATRKAPSAPARFNPFAKALAKGLGAPSNVSKVSPSRPTLASFGMTAGPALFKNPPKGWVQPIPSNNP